MVDFSIQNMMDALAQALFGGSTDLAGMAVLLGVFFICMLFMAAVKAPVTYGLVPMIPITIFFGYLGVMSAELSILITIICVVVTAITATKVTGGGA